MTERVAAAGRDGFDAVEFHWPYDTPPADLRAAMSAAGVIGVSVNTSRGDPAAGEFGLSAVAGRSGAAREAIDRAFDYAVEAGIGAVHVMAGKSGGHEARATFLNNLEYACGLAAATGRTVLIEPLNTRDVPGYFLTGTDQASALMDELQLSPLRIMYDFYHMQIMQGDHVRHLGALGARVGHVQLAAVPDRTEPYAGELDHAWILNRVGYKDIIGLEYRPRVAPDLCLERLAAAFGAVASRRP